MADEGARLGDWSDPVGHLRDRIARLPDLRREGLRLVSEGDVGAVGAWRHHWTALLNEIRAPLELEAPRQTEVVLWPAVNEAQPLEEIRGEMVRAAVGCRELALLVRELGGIREDRTEASGAISWSEGAPPGSTYVGAGRRFEGAIRLRQLIEPAQDSLIVIDPYMDDGTFTLAAAAPSGVSRRFLTSNHASVRREVADAWTSWQVNWEGESQCLTGNGLPHFRLLFVDGAAYLIDSSLKDFGARLTFLRMLPTDERHSVESEIESTWRRATPL